MSLAACRELQLGLVQRAWATRWLSELKCECRLPQLCTVFIVTNTVWPGRGLGPKAAAEDTGTGLDSQPPKRAAYSPFASAQSGQMSLAEPTKHSRWSPFSSCPQLPNEPPLKAENHRSLPALLSLKTSQTRLVLSPPETADDFISTLGPQTSAQRLVLSYSVQHFTSAFLPQPSFPSCLPSRLQLPPFCFSFCPRPCLCSP